MRINASTMSEFIGHLESDGYVERNIDPSDKRATLITLTEKGRERAFELQDERKEKLNQLLSFSAVENNIANFKVHIFQA